MPYLKLITIVVLLLLVSAIATAIYFVTIRPESIAPRIQLTDKIHSSFYQQALGYWDARLLTAPFQERSSSMIVLQWTKPTQIYNHFLITVTDPKTGWTHTESGEHDRESLNITNLAADTKYVFVLRACIDADCSTWLTSEREAEHRTQKMIWQLTDDADDLGAFDIRENWETSVMLPNIILQHEDESVWTTEQKNTLTIQRVVLINGPYEQMMILEEKEGTVLSAKLLNP